MKLTLRDNNNICLAEMKGKIAENLVSLLMTEDIDFPKPKDPEKKILRIKNPDGFTFKIMVAELVTIIYLWKDFLVIIEK